MTAREQQLAKALVDAGIPLPDAPPPPAAPPPKPMIRFSHDMFKGKTDLEREQIIAEMAAQPDPDMRPNAAGVMKAHNPAPRGAS